MDDTYIYSVCAQRAIRDFLFENTACSVMVIAVMYKLVEMAKKDGINPYDYLV